MCTCTDSSYSDLNDEIMVTVCFKDFEDTDFLSSATKVTFYNLETCNPSCEVMSNEKVFDFVGKFEYHLGHKLYFRSDGSYHFIGDSAKQLTFRLKQLPLFR